MTLTGIFTSLAPPKHPFWLRIWLNLATILLCTQAKMNRQIKFHLHKVLSLVQWPVCEWYLAFKYREDIISILAIVWFDTPRGRGRKSREKERGQLCDLRQAATPPCSARMWEDVGKLAHLPVTWPSAWLACCINICTSRKSLEDTTLSRV